MSLTKVSYSMIQGAVVNALDFGADTASANNATAFQAAIDSLASGGVVYIPEGTYTLTAGVTVPSNVTVQGAGIATVVTSASNIDLFSSTGTAGARKSNLAIRDIKLVKTAGTGDFVKLTYVDDSLLENVSMVGFGNSNAYMRLAGTRKCIVSNCRGDTMAQLLLCGSAATTGDYGEENLATDSYFSGGSQGVTIILQKKLRLIGVTSNNNGSATNIFGVGFDLEGGPSEDVVLMGCVAKDNYIGGFYIEGVSGGLISNVSFIGCMADSNVGGVVGNGFTLEQNFANITISACISTNNKYGIVSSGNKHVHICDNNVSNNTTDGIWIDNGYLVTITGNTIRDSGAYGIRLLGSPNSFSIANNTFESNTSGNVTGFTYAAGYFDAFGVQTYTPTLTGSVSGSATLTNSYGYYQIFQGRCTGRIFVSNSTASTVSGEWRFSLPATAASGTAQGGSGAVTFTRDLPTSANATYFFLNIAANTNYGTLSWGYDNGTESAGVTGSVTSNVICAIDFSFYVA